MIWSIWVKAAGNQSYSRKRATRPPTARQSLMSVPPMSMPQMAVPSMPLVASAHNPSMRVDGVAFRATRRPARRSRTRNRPRDGVPGAEMASSMRSETLTARP